jgi:hypothetical protein
MVSERLETALTLSFAVQGFGLLSSFKSRRGEPEAVTLTSPDLAAKNVLRRLSGVLPVVGSS